jgi:hypothetical protein
MREFEMREREGGIVSIPRTIRPIINAMCSVMSMSNPSSMFPPLFLFPFALPAHHAKGPTIVDFTGVDSLNLVITRPGVYPFGVADVPEVWRDYYPNLAQQSTMAAINEIFHAVGYLFIFDQSQCIPCGTAFQLAPSVIATSLHVVEDIKKDVLLVASFSTHQSKADLQVLASSPSC